jgi:hypothetical protein
LRGVEIIMTINVINIYVRHTQEDIQKSRLNFIVLKTIDLEFQCFICD